MKTVAAWSLLASLTMPALAQSAAAIDLLDVHRRALTSAPLLVRAQAARDEQQANVLAAAAPLGPQLLARLDAAVGSHGTRQAALQWNQSLYNAPARSLHEAAQWRLQSREAELAVHHQQLRHASARLYLLWHAQQQSLRVQTDLAGAYAEEAARMGVRHQQGLTAAVDWRQSQSFQWLAEASARGSAQRLHALRQELVAHAADRELARAPLRPLRPAALPPPAGPDLQWSTLRLAALRFENAAREQEVQSARAAQGPQLSLQAQAQRALSSGHGVTSGLSLQLSLPLWDSGSRSAASEAALQRVRAVAAEQLQQDRELQREAATHTERLQAAQEQHRTAEGALAAAEQTVRAMRVGQEQGGRSTADVLLALQTQAQLRELAAQAQVQAWLAWIDLLAALGRFDDAALATLNEQLE